MYYFNVLNKMLSNSSQLCVLMHVDDFTFIAHVTHTDYNAWKNISQQLNPHLALTLYG